MPNPFDPSAFLPQKSVSVRSFIKTAFTEALREVFLAHPDPKLVPQFDAAGNRISGVAVTIENPNEEIAYPCIVVRWLERNVQNAGVGHIEYIEDPDTGLVYPFRHTYYTGSIQFDVYALSSLDRDLVADSLIQIIRMPDMASYTQQFFDQIFNDTDPSNTLNYINIDTDNVASTGETTSRQPWMSENQLQYQTGYRSKVFGEFYSLPPDTSPASPISSVTAFPYVIGIDALPTGSDDPAPWTPESSYEPPILE